MYHFCPIALGALDDHAKLESWRRLRLLAQDVVNSETSGTYSLLRFMLYQALISP